MLIEIESVSGDKILHGKYLTKFELQNVMNEFFEMVYEQDFISAFCTHLEYEEIQYSNDVRVDYVIDLDTHQLIKPEYE